MLVFSLLTLFFPIIFSPNSNFAIIYKKNSKTSGENIFIWDIKGEKLSKLQTYRLTEEGMYLFNWVNDSLFVFNDINNGPVVLDYRGNFIFTPKNSAVLKVENGHYFNLDFEYGKSFVKKVHIDTKKENAIQEVFFNYPDFELCPYFLLRSNLNKPLFFTFNFSSNGDSLHLFEMNEKNIKLVSNINLKSEVEYYLYSLSFDNFLFYPRIKLLINNKNQEFSLIDNVYLFDDKLYCIKEDKTIIFSKNKIEVTSLLTVQLFNIGNILINQTLYALDFTNEKVFKINH